MSSVQTDYYWKRQERILDEFVSLVDDWQTDPEVFVTFDQIETELEKANEDSGVSKETYMEMKRYWDEVKFAEDFSVEHPDRSAFNRGIFDATLAPFFNDTTEVY